MDNTAEKSTEPARTFAEMIRLNNTPLFLHTLKGSVLTSITGWAALVTAMITQDAGLAAACGALFFPAGIGAMTIADTKAANNLLVNGAAFGGALALSAFMGYITVSGNNYRAYVQSLPEMSPDTIITKIQCDTCRPGGKFSPAYYFNCSIPPKMAPDAIVVKIPRYPEFDSSPLRMDPTVGTTAKEYFCPPKATGWRIARGMKLNCGD